VYETHVRTYIRPRKLDALPALEGTSHEKQGSQDPFGYVRNKTSWPRLPNEAMATWTEKVEVEVAKAIQM